MRATDLINQAVAKAGLAEINAIPTKLYTMCLSWLNRRYELLWDAYAWRNEKLVGVNISVTANEGTIIFPQAVDAIRALRDSDIPVGAISEITLARFTPQAFTEDGTKAYNYFQKPDSPVLVQPTAASIVKVLSSATTDTSDNIRVFGLVSGVETYEDITLDAANSTTPVSGSTSWDAGGLVSISKPLTDGRITIRNSADAELGTIAPWDNKGAYRQIELYPTPTTSTTLYAEATRKFPRLTSDEDTILLAKAEGALFEMLMAEIYEYAEEDAKSQAAEAKASALVSGILNTEEVKNEEDKRSYPESGMFSDVETHTNTILKTG